MVKVILDLIGAVLLHVFIVAFLGLVGFFVWNSGAVGIANNLPTISYLTATAIMLGLYIMNLFIKIQVNRIISLRNQKYMIDKIVDFYKNNAPKGWFLALFFIAKKYFKISVIGQASIAIYSTISNKS